LKWYFQFTPGDEYDWDATQVPVLADMDWQGKPSKLMLWANRNGFFYVLDRTTGEFLMGKPFIKETWAKGLDKDGKPIKLPEFWPKPAGGIEVMPGSQGGTNWYAPSFSPQTRLFYLAVWDNYKALSGKGDPGPWAPGQRYTGTGTPVPCVKDGHVVPGTCGGSNGSRPPVGGMHASPNYKMEAEGYGAIRAIDPETGEKKWDFKMVNNTESGVLSTAGGLVFGGGMDGDFIALDAKTGQPLWHVNLGGPNASGPISYAVDGKQYIIGTGEGTMYSFALPD
jgi:alcohol dehydrogenase (cytochrome c)